MPKKLAKKTIINFELTRLFHYFINMKAMMPVGMNSVYLENEVLMVEQKIKELQKLVEELPDDEDDNDDQDELDEFELESKK